MHHRADYSLPIMERLSSSSRATCSVVIPVYNEQGNIATLQLALSTVAETETSVDWEFLFVDDGSTDNTFALLSDFASNDLRFKVLRLSRNYGSHVAAAAGLRYASGDCAVIMAGDLQDHPREIPRFLAKWRRRLSRSVGRARHAARQLGDPHAGQGLRGAHTAHSIAKLSTKRHRQLLFARSQSSRCSKFVSRAQQDDLWSHFDGWIPADADRI